MPPRALSRHGLTFGVRDDADRLVLTERVPYGYRPLPDNVVHVVAEGDTWHSLAARYYASVSRAAGLWWVIADFQPTPVLDPTVPPPVGSSVVVPSVSTVLTRVLSDDRRLDEEV